MKTTPPTRAIFVLRLWKNSPRSDWIVEIQDVKSGGITHLQSLDAIPACIRGQIEAQPMPEASEQSIIGEDGSEHSFPPETDTW